MIQNGVVLSEVLREPGPTHSVFDVLAAATFLGRKEPAEIAVLGFGGGGVLAALRALGCQSIVHAVDKDVAGWRILSAHADGWLSRVEWYRQDAVQWLRQNRRRFDLIIEDLSVGANGDVIKPEATWTVLPRLIQSRLRSGGGAIFNLLRPPGMSWANGIDEVARPFAGTPGLVISMDAFENRIVLLGALDHAPRACGRQLREVLRRLRSRMATGVRVSSLSPE